MKSKKEKKKGKKSHKDEKKSERKIEKKAKKKAKKERKEREKKLKEQLLSVKQPHNEKEETAVKPKGKECEDDVDCGPSIGNFDFKRIMDSRIHQISLQS